MFRCENMPCPLLEGPTPSCRSWVKEYRCLALISTGNCLVCLGYCGQPRYKRSLSRRSTENVIRIIMHGCKSCHDQKSLNLSWLLLEHAWYELSHKLMISCADCLQIRQTNEIRQAIVSGNPSTHFSRISLELSISRVSLNKPSVFRIV